MKLTTRIASILMLLVLFCAANEANAQKTPKLKGLAKQVVGKWIIEGMDIDVDASKLSDEKKQEYEKAKPMLAMMGEQMKGKLIFDIKADGTIESESKDKEGEEPTKRKGTWTMEGNQLTFDMPNASTSEPKTFTTAVTKELLSLSMQPKPEEPVKLVMKFKRTK